MKKIFISQENSNQRLDKFLLKYFNSASKSFIYKLIRKKNIKLNNKKSFGNEILKPNDSVFLYLSEDTINKFKKPVFKIKSKVKSNKKLDILYENKDILICNKPAGVLSQPDSKFDNHTLLNYLYNFYGDEIRICNRLDRNTSGIIICGKNFLATQQINNLIANRLIEKFYLTIVKGQINKSGYLENYIKKNKTKNICCLDKKNRENKKIITEYRPIKFNNNFSLLELKLITGRSHQIRLHMKSINHEIIGDRKYGDKDINKFFYNKFGLKNQLLHAYKIKFKSSELALNNLKLDSQEIICPLPKIFLDIKKVLFD